MLFVLPFCAALPARKDKKKDKNPKLCITCA